MHATRTRGGDGRPNRTTSARLYVRVWNDGTPAGVAGQRMHTACTSPYPNPDTDLDHDQSHDQSRKFQNTHQTETEQHDMNSKSTSKAAVLSVCVAGIVGITPQALSSRIADIETTGSLFAATLSGAIESVSDTDSTFVVRTKGEDAKAVTVSFTEKTRYTLDGEYATQEEVIKAGLEVTVVHEDAVATLVAAKSMSDD